MLKGLYDVNHGRHIAFPIAILCRHTILTTLRTAYACNYFLSWLISDTKAKIKIYFNTTL